MKIERHSVALGLGSNVGDRRDRLEQAIAELSGVIGNLRRSHLYESPAMLPEGAPQTWDMPFLNMVVAGETCLAPLELLQKTQELENTLGRVRRGHWGPREIDIDLLLYGNVVMDSPVLTLPHPGIGSRDFVLLPLCDVMPEWVIAVPGTFSGMNVRQAVKQLAESPVCRVEE